MGASLSCRMNELWWKMFHLEQEAERLIGEMPENVRSAHSIARLEACRITLAIAELRDAMKVWEADRDSLDACTEQAIHDLPVQTMSHDPTREF